MSISLNSLCSIPPEMADIKVDLLSYMGLNYSTNVIGWRTSKVTSVFSIFIWQRKIFNQWFNKIYSFSIVQSVRGEGDLKNRWWYLVFLLFYVNESSTNTSGLSLHNSKNKWKYNQLIHDSFRQWRKWRWSPFSAHPEPTP